MEKGGRKRKGGKEKEAENSTNGDIVAMRSGAQEMGSRGKRGGNVVAMRRV